MVKIIKLGVRGKMLDIVRSMYASVKSRVKLSNNLSNSFECHIGVRQGECLSPFLFSMFVNGIEETFIQQGVSGIDLNTLKMFIILYADGIVLFADNAEDLQHDLNVLHEYCQKWKLTVNIMKTKVMVDYSKILVLIMLANQLTLLVSLYTLE